jgi:glyoxylase-like metal-dependent hydrolase (beta-lactamase superfamily II)
MMKNVPIYEVYAMRYATQDRQRRDNFISYPDYSDVHDSSMPLDYFVWIILGSGKTYLVDTGFNAETARARRRTFLRCPIRSWANAGLATPQLSEVIITHMHFDHAGNMDLLPTAHFHLQERELQYVTGRFMQYKFLRTTFAVEDVVSMVRSLYDNRVHFYLGDDEIAEGIQLIQVGGHTAGLQAVRVHTQRGWIMLASDASHFYENIFRESPFPIVLNVGEMLDGYHKLLRLCESPDHLIPGHDPLVLQRYPKRGDPEHEIVALHQTPVEELDLRVNAAR